MRGVTDFREVSASLCADLREAFSPRLEEIADDAATHIELLTAELVKIYSGNYPPGQTDWVPLVVTRGMIADMRRESYLAGRQERALADDEQIDGEEVDL